MADDQLIWTPEFTAAEAERVRADLQRHRDGTRDIVAGSVALGTLVAAFRKHRLVADRVLDKQGRVPVLRAYDAETSRLIRALMREQRKRTPHYMGPGDVAMLLFLLRRGLREVMARVASTAAGVGAAIARDSMRETAAILAATTGTAPAVTDATIRGAARTIEATTAGPRGAATGRILARIDQRVVEAVQTLPPTVPTREVEGAIEGAIDDSVWDVERTATTEAGSVFNEGAEVILESVEDQYPGMYMRWTEHINDITMQPLDNRVGKDSMALHAQIAKPGGVFTMPGDDPRAPARMIGQSWLRPPNRPNDRACLTPWFAAWDIPAWVYDSGSKRWLRPPR